MIPSDIKHIAISKLSSGISPCLFILPTLFWTFELNISLQIHDMCDSVTHYYSASLSPGKFCINRLTYITDNLPSWKNIKYCRSFI